MISMVVIERVSEAKASGTTRRRGNPARKSGTIVRRVAEDEGKQNRRDDGGAVAPAECGADNHAEHLSDRAPGQAVHGCAER